MFAAVKRHMREFSEETFIFGLHLLRERVSAAEWLFWILTVLTFACLTLRDVTNLTRTWLAEDTVTIAQWQENGSVYFSPSPTVAMSVRTDLFRLATTDPAALVEKAEKFVLAYQNWSRGELNETYLIDSLDAELVELTYVVLISISDLEFRLTRARLGELNGTADLLWAQLYRKRKNFLQLNWATRNLFNIFMRSGVRFNHLTQIVGVWYCREYEIETSTELYSRFFEGWRSWKGQPCRMSKVVHIDKDGVNVRLFSVDLRFGSSTDKLKITAKNFTDGAPLWLDLAGGAATEFEKHSDSSAFLYPGSHDVQMRIRIASLFRRCSRSTKRCSASNSWYACSEMCSANLTLQRCACWPLYYASVYDVPSGAELCPGSKWHEKSEPLVDGYYAVPFRPRCLRINEDEAQNIKETILNCEHRCMPDCESRAYIFSVNYVRREPHEVDFHGYSVSISLRSLTFPVFEERLALTSDIYLSQFGGSLGLWLGVSFAALVHIPVFLFRKCVELLWKRERKTSKKDARSKSVVALQPVSFIAQPHTHGVEAVEAKR